MKGDRVEVVVDAGGSVRTYDIEATRAGTLRLTCIAGIARMPALSVPVLTTPNGPAGLCLVGPRFGDRSLIQIGAELAAGV